MRKFLIGLVALLLAGPASAQYITQTGSVTANHAAAWSSSGVLKDAGTSALGKLTTLGITASGGTPFCVSNGTGSGGTSYSQFCMGLDTSNAYFQINGFNGASALGFQININGTPISLGTGNVTGPGSSTSNDVVAFNGTSGTVIKDTGILYTALATLSGNNAWTGNETHAGTEAFSGGLTASGSNVSDTLSPTGSGTVTINPATAGALDNMVIGANTAKAGSFTTLTASSTQTFTGAATFNGGITASGSGVSDTFSPTGAGTVTINPATAGTLNNMVIGGSTALAGSFTTLAASGAATFSSTSTHTGAATFNGALTASPTGANITLSPGTTGTVTVNPNTAGAMDNMVVGNSTPLAGHFTTLSTTGVSTLAAGAVGAPSINFGDATTGFYRTASNQVGVAVAGSLIGNWTSTGLNSANIGATTPGTAAFTTLSSTSTTNLVNTTYSTVLTPSLTANPTYTYTSTANGISALQMAPTLVPSGASAGSTNGLAVVATVGTSAVNISSLRALEVELNTAAGYSGTAAAGSSILVNAPGISGSIPLTVWDGITIGASANGNGITSGTVSNNGIDTMGASASAGSGGVIVNSGIKSTLPTGAGAGTTTDYGLYVTGNGGSGGGGTTNNFAIYSDSTAASSLAGALTVTGASVLSNASITFTNLATDATHTDRTVCQDTTSKALFFGSGAAGICLGTSSLRFKLPETVKPIYEGLAQVRGLKPVNFYYRRGYGDDGAKEQYGFIAEDVVKVLPGVVGLDKEGKPNSVDMMAMVPVLVHAIQDLQHEVSDLRAQIAANENGVVPAVRRTVR